MLWSAVVLSCLALAAAGPLVQREEGEKVRVEVYFESMCGNSRAFMRNQMAPAWRDLRELMEVHFNAYGSITMTKSDDDSYQFNCQHGPRECEGNKLLQCANKYITNRDQLTDFTVCIMTSKLPPNAGQTCATEAGVSFEEIDTCRSGREGSELLMDAGKVQYSLTPAVDYVPWLIVNGAHNFDLQRMAERNLMKTVCITYKGDLPAACNEYRAEVDAAREDELRAKEEGRDELSEEREQGEEEEQVVMQSERNVADELFFEPQSNEEF